MATKNPKTIDPFGELIKQARIDKGLTQAELGDACGVSQAAAGAWESGNGKPTVKNLHLLASALDLSVELLREKLLESTGSKLSGALGTKPVDVNRVLPVTPSYFNRVREIFGTDADEEQPIGDILEYALEHVPGLRKDFISHHATGLKWSVPIQTDNYAVDIHIGNRRINIINAVFHLATFRAASADKRDYFLVVVNPSGDSKSNFIQDRNLKLLEIEASFVGVTIERVDSIEDAKILIKTIDDWQRHIKNNR